MNEDYKVRPILLYLSLLFGFIGVLVKLLYRPWINNNNINDFGFNGFAPNFIFTIGICLFVSFFVTKKTVSIMIFSTVGILLYETEQILTSRTFDYLDVLATIIGLVAAISIYKMINRREKLKTVDVIDGDIAS